MIPDLPSPLLRSFVAVIECGSLAGASTRIGRSESALSLQMARLEDIVGRALFDRDGRALKLNDAGTLLLPHARAILGRIDAARADLGQAAAPPIRIGIVQDFVDSVLRPTLSELHEEGLTGAITIVIGSTTQLLQAMSEDRIDTALCAGEPVGGGATQRLAMRWFGDPGLLRDDVVTLVGITPPCPFLKAAQDALDFAGRPWRMALTTPSLDGVRAAVQAGLGLTCRTEVGLKLPPLPDGRLPKLPDIAYSVMERRQSGFSQGVARRLAKHVAALSSEGRPASV
ncbi:LysR family transcriptional regulator [Rhodomicrobium sp.]|uniref:LysR family transcriptional regulator n=1 Tax=Rhodomicrobium sp. TaxID=2720632 RepID=UPI0039E65C97